MSLGLIGHLCTKADLKYRDFREKLTTEEFIVSDRSSPTFLQRLAEYDSPSCLHPKAGLHTRLSKKRYSFWIIQIVNPSVVVKAGIRPSPSIENSQIYIDLAVLDYG
jgi:hypothetical protein